MTTHRDPDQVSPSSGAKRAGGDRRDALKTFGRYAAVAPTTLLLLAPRPSHASTRWWWWWWKKKKKGDDGGYG